MNISFLKVLRSNKFVMDHVMGDSQIEKSVLDVDPTLGGRGYIFATSRFNV